MCKDVTELCAPAVFFLMQWSSTEPKAQDGYSSKRKQGHLVFGNSFGFFFLSFPEHIIKDKLKEREREKERVREKEKKKDREKDKEQAKEKEREKKKHKLMNEIKRENGEVKLLQKGESRTDRRHTLEVYTHLG